MKKKYLSVRVLVSKTFIEHVVLFHCTVYTNIIHLLSFFIRLIYICHNSLFYWLGICNRVFSLYFFFVVPSFVCYELCVCSVLHCRVSNNTGWGFYLIFTCCCSILFLHFFFHFPHRSEVVGRTICFHCRYFAVFLVFVKSTAPFDQLSVFFENVCQFYRSRDIFMSQKPCDWLRLHNIIGFFPFWQT